MELAPSIKGSTRRETTTMSMHSISQPTSYPDGRTKQSFKDETDINKILKRAQKTGTISHLNKHEGRYADFSDFDFFTNLQMLSQGREIFDDLPSEIRREFNNSPAGFFKYVNDPENKDRLAELLPALAEPGRQNVDVRGNMPADEVAALEAREQPSESVASGDATEKASTAASDPLSGSDSDE